MTRTVGVLLVPMESGLSLVTVVGSSIWSLPSLSGCMVGFLTVAVVPGWVGALLCCVCCVGCGGSFCSG